MAHYSSDTPYNRDEKLLIAIDLGTTHSAVSYSYLYPGDHPVVRLINKWPGQPAASGDAKIPSLVAYKNGKLEACGAEATEHVGDTDYEIAKWFKLHLHPDSMKISEEPPAYGSNISRAPSIEIPPLPTGVSLKKVYADFLKYMYERTHEFFIGNMPAGSRVWDRLQSDIVVVLATPNGWDSAQQAFLRGASIQAGFVKESDADARLDFVTEGEASVHYALAHSQSNTWLKPGILFAVTDAGGSTVDSTLYECKALKPKLVLEEVCASECVQAGGVFIDRAARTMLEGKLTGSRFREDEFIDLMVTEFEQKTKRIFDGSQNSNVVHFGRSSDNDRNFHILKGKMSLDKNDVGRTFDDAITRIVNSCQKLLSGRNVEYLLLVGGFGESPFLRNRLKETFGRTGTDVVTVDEPSKKAAAEGAGIWYIKQLVVARAARFTFGTDVQRTYNPTLPVHIERQHAAYIDDDGLKKIDGFFAVWIKKGTVINEEFQETFSYYRSYRNIPNTLGEFTMQIYAWEGEGISDWVKDENGRTIPKMRELCTITADLSRLRSSLTMQDGANGARFWKVSFKVCVLFGGTRLQARLQWMEGTKLCEGPIAILPNSTY